MLEEHYFSGFSLFLLPHIDRDLLLPPAADRSPLVSSGIGGASGLDLSFLSDLSFAAEVSSEEAMLIFVSSIYLAL